MPKIKDGKTLKDFIPQSSDEKVKQAYAKLSPKIDASIDARTKAEMQADEAGEKSRSENHKKNDGEIVAETGGPKGLEPTRYGDWERAGRCFDF